MEEMVVLPENELPKYVLAIIKAYEDHIATLRERIKELEGKNLIVGPVGPPLPQRQRIRTTSQLAQRLEERSQIRDKEVNDEDVR